MTEAVVAKQKVESVALLLLLARRREAGECLGGVELR